MRYTILSFTLVLVTSCTCASAQSQNGSPKAETSQSKLRYFPEGVFAEDGRASSWRENWYSMFLIALQEPSLLEAAKTADAPSYRFLLVWNATALSVRLTLSGDGTGVLGRKLVTLDSTRKIESQGSVAVSKEQVQQLDSLLQSAGFWSMKTEEAPPKNVYHLDGAQWILEGAKAGSYHIVDRWSPTGTDYEKVCNYLITLSPVKLGRTAPSTRVP